MDLCLVDYLLPELLIFLEEGVRERVERKMRDKNILV